MGKVQKQKPPASFFADRGCNIFDYKNSITSGAENASLRPPRGPQG